MSVQPGAPTRVFAYVRVSTDQQEQSPTVQLAAIRRAFGEPTEIFQDLATPGDAELSKRPGLQSLLARLCPGDVLAVAKRDRLARSTFLTAWLMKDSQVRRYRIEAADGTATGDTPDGQLMASVVDAFAAYELAVIRARTRAALAAKRVRGERTGSVPFGFRLMKDGKNLRPDEKQQQVIATLMRMHRAKPGLRRIARALTKRGIPGPAGGAWNPVTVKNIVAREEAGAYEGARRRA